MDTILIKRREIFFNNLLLLGLDRLLFEKKHGISFHKDMFLLPNKKGYEVVTHFLFSKLSTVTGKDYNIPWPLLSKELDRIFQKTCYSHLSSFAQENCVTFPRIVSSVLSTFGGDRFYEVYLAFSCYVLKNVIRKNGNIQLQSRPAITQTNVHRAESIIQLSTIICMQKFNDIEKVTLSSHIIWTKVTKNLSDCLRKLKLLIRSNEEAMKKKTSALCSFAPSESLTKSIEKVLQLWKPVLRKNESLGEFFLKEKNLWQYIASEVDDSKEDLILDGQEFNITFDLSEEYITSEKAGFATCKEDGKLSVSRFLKLFMVHLEFITETLKKADIDKLHKSCLVEDASTIEDSLNHVEKLNKMLEELIKETEENIERLKLTSSYVDSSLDSQLSSSQFCSALPTPSFSSEAIRERVPQLKGDVLPIIQDAPTVYEISLPELLQQNKVNKDENKLDACQPLQHNVHLKENLPSATRDISFLDDIEFNSPPFKMRPSWLLEESLNSVTLPDMPFDV